MNNAIWRCRELLLAEFGIELPAGFEEGIESFRELLVEWNDYADLISDRELADAFEDHVADSLSVLPLVARYLQEGLGYLDFGSGGGFPAIPVLLGLDGAESMLIERSERKCAFLAKVVRRLGIGDCEVVQGSFPEALPGDRAWVITGRAVRPLPELLPSLVPLLEAGSTFLWQGGEQGPGAVADAVVEPVADGFDSSGLRRGRLYIFRGAAK